MKSKIYKTYILDLDGTVYLDGKLFDGLLDYILDLHKGGVRFIFLTNNTSTSKSTYVQKLNNIGLNFVNSDNILTPIDVFLDFAKNECYRSAFYLLPNDVIDYIELNDGPIHTKKNPDIVLIGFDKELNYNKLVLACKLINDGVSVYSTHVDLACPTINGPIPDCGSIVKLIEATTNSTILCDFGKPSILMSLYLKKMLANTNLETTFLGGDRLYTDIKLGSLMGIDTLLVDTGEKSIYSKDSPTPTHHFNNLKSFIKWQKTLY